MQSGCIYGRSGLYVLGAEAEASQRKDSAWRVKTSPGFQRGRAGSKSHYHWQNETAQQQHFHSREMESGEITSPSTHLKPQSSTNSWPSHSLVAREPELPCTLLPSQNLNRGTRFRTPEYSFGYSKNPLRDNRQSNYRSRSRPHLIHNQMHRVCKSWRDYTPKDISVKISELIRLHLTDHWLAALFWIHR